MNVEGVNKKLENLSSLEMLKWALKEFKDCKISLSTSFGAEGIVILDMLLRISSDFEVFTIDTGRNFNETYDVWQRIIDRYGIEIKVYSPEPEDLDELINGYGPNLFYKSPEDRKRCCYIRKVKPLRKALRNTSLWVTGLRREQSGFRNETKIFSWNKAHETYKFCPLAKWSQQNVWDYIRNNNVPYNSLYDKGYFTIGCQPCTRPGRPAESSRSCRWWWEKDSNKECGIHFEGGKVKRNKETLNWNI
ncbi:MAG: phosphoadenylyl-sulfate reductase [Victivallales bacterium]|nr:phosphoadenylyl-sulfate reductase [Victivallales bacterium]MCF7888523.1 phosphoadenylyl-sulfate reductase [Victivallales bacterium]